MKLFFYVLGLDKLLIKRVPKRVKRNEQSLEFAAWVSGFHLSISNISQLDFSGVTVFSSRKIAAKVDSIRSIFFRTVHWYQFYRVSEEEEIIPHFQFLQAYMALKTSFPG